MRVIALLFFVLASMQAKSGEAEDIAHKRAVAALDNLSRWFDNRIVRFRCSESSASNDGPLGTATGDMIYARSGQIVLGDVRVKFTAQRLVQGYKSIPDSEELSQIYLSNKTKLLHTDYVLQNNKLLPTSISVRPREEYEASLRTAAAYTRLEGVVSAAEPTGMPLAVFLASLTPQIVTTDASGRTHLDYPNIYGRLEVDIGPAASHGRVLSISFLQGRGDTYTNLSGGMTLAKVAESDLGRNPNGLDSVKRAFAFAYDKNGDLSAITIEEHWAAGQRFLGLKREMNVTSVQPCDSADKLENLRVPIPNGFEVRAVGDEFRNLKLVMLDGEVVRQVDSSPLDEALVTPPRLQRRRPPYIPVTVAALALLGAIAYLSYRRRRTTGGS